MRKGIATVAFAFAMAAAFGEDLRPPFDKSDYKGNVSVHVNPWFPLDKPGVDAFGGPNIPWIRYTEDAWRRGMELCAEYGVTSFLPEMNEPTANSGCVRALLDGAAASGNANIKVGMFFGFYSKTADGTIAAMKRILEPLRKDLKDNPHMLRAGGHPVILVHTPYKYKADEWKRIFDALDAEFGRMVYLLNYRMLALPRGGENAAAVERRFEEDLMRLLPVFDGVSNYGSNGIGSQRMCARVLSRVMKERFPGKIYEAGIHGTYLCHFNMGGLEVSLSRQWRASVDLYFETAPDSELLTNLFDHYENSLVYPCYEREDFLLRYFEWANHKWTGRKFRFEKEPEIVLANHNMVQLGWEKLDFEVMAFPVDSDARDLTVALQLCDTSGRVLKEFEPRTMRLDDFRCESYSVPSTDFASERGVVPRVKYVWKGKERFTDYNPMTLISPSLRSYHMYWARSTRNRLRTKGASDWTLGGVGPGGTLVSRGVGQTLLSCGLDNEPGTTATTGYRYHVVKRDWTDFYRTTDGRLKANVQQLFNLPDPGGALHFYHVEIENAMGRKAQTLPIWHMDGSRAGNVRIPVKKEDGTIANYNVEAMRVPFWHYPCDEDGGRFLVDVSGYQHNGAINGSGYGGGHLGHTGYNHYHNGPVARPGEKWRSLFARDEDGRGFLRFGGKDYAVVMGGTAFPGASTYEIEVRPAEIGTEMGLFGSGNNQISVDMLADGRVRAARRSENEGPNGVPRVGSFVDRKVESSVKLVPGKWAKIQVVYDLKNLALYVDGAHQGEVRSHPIVNHERQTHLIVGAKCSWVWNPKDNFKGDIRGIRVYGRNLSPSEFLGQ